MIVPNVVGMLLLSMALQCLPPGVSAITLAGQVVGVSVVVLSDEADQPVLGRLVRYVTRRGVVDVVWVNDDVVIVDPSPDTDAPPLGNARFIDESTRTVKREPSGPCRWFRAPPR